MTDEHDPPPYQDKDSNVEPPPFVRQLLLELAGMRLAMQFLASLMLTQDIGGQLKEAEQQKPPNPQVTGAMRQTLIAVTRAKEEIAMKFAQSVGLEVSTIQRSGVVPQGPD